MLPSGRCRPAQQVKDLVCSTWAVVLEYGSLRWPRYIDIPSSSESISIIWDLQLCCRMLTSVFHATTRVRGHLASMRGTLSIYKWDWVAYPNGPQYIRKSSGT